MSRDSNINLGLTQTQMLWLIAKKPSHGYALMKELSRIKKTKVTQAMVYPALNKLVKAGLVKARHGERGKKVYELTAKGKKVTRETCREFVEMFSGIFTDFMCRKCKR